MCRPVLIGTSSVQESENVLNTILSFTSDKYEMQKNYIQVLNAKPDKVGDAGISARSILHFKVVEECLHALPLAHCQVPDVYGYMLPLCMLSIEAQHRLGHPNLAVSTPQHMCSLYGRASTSGAALPPHVLPVHSLSTICSTVHHMLYCPPYAIYCVALEEVLALPRVPVTQVRLEAQIVAQAGLPGAVTIATNMAGRGTDIILGGSAEGLTKMLLLKLVYGRLMLGALRGAQHRVSCRSRPAGRALVTSIKESDARDVQHRMSCRSSWPAGLALSVTVEEGLERGRAGLAREGCSLQCSWLTATWAANKAACVHSSPLRQRLLPSSHS